MAAQEKPETDMFYPMLFVMFVFLISLAVPLLVISENMENEDADTTIPSYAALYVFVAQVMVISTLAFVLLNVFKRFAANVR